MCPRPLPAALLPRKQPRNTMSLSPSLVRLVVLPDGEVHVTFSDHSAVIINHTATVLAIVNPDGTTVRHLTQCVTSVHRQRATQALHARNALCVDAPRVQWALLPPDRAVCYFDAPSRPQRVSWPSPSAHEAIVHHADGAVRVLRSRTPSNLTPEHDLQACIPNHGVCPALSVAASIGWRGCCSTRSSTSLPCASRRLPTRPTWPRLSTFSSRCLHTRPHPSSSRHSRRSRPQRSAHPSTFSSHCHRTHPQDIMHHRRRTRPHPSSRACALPRS